MIYTIYIDSTKRKEFNDHISDVIDLWFEFNGNNPTKERIDALKDTINVTMRDFHKWDIYTGLLQNTTRMYDDH